MRFALLGNHPDGVELARALAGSGRHQVVAHTAPLGEEALAAMGRPGRARDVEETLADPAVEAVIVAGVPEYRPEQLRRALQSERHVLCVHPADQGPELAYEAAMIQKDSGVVLLPILPRASHPAVRRLASLLGRGKGGGAELGPLRLLQVEWAAEGDVLDNLGFGGTKPSFPGWEVLRALGGEIGEVSGYARGEELAPGEPVLLAGRLDGGGLFQMSLLPGRPAAAVRLTARADRGEAELYFPLGWQGPAFLNVTAGAEGRPEEAWDAWDPWPALVEQFEAALAGHAPLPAPAPVGAGSEAAPQRGASNPGSPAIQADRPVPRSQAVTAQPPAPVARPAAGEVEPTWQEEIRCLELDDAARRAVKYRRAQAMEYPEASEEVGFKGTMTLVGCGMLWATLLLLVVSRWLPALGVVIVPLFVLFLLLQLLRYLLPPKPER